MLSLDPISVLNSLTSTDYVLQCPTGRPGLIQDVVREVEIMVNTAKLPLCVTSTKEVITSIPQNPRDRLTVKLSGRMF